MEVQNGFYWLMPTELEKYSGYKDVIVIDLRREEDYKKGHIEKAISIPYEEVEDKQYWLDPSKQYILYCERGNLSLQMARKLHEEGYQVATLMGGIHNYKGKIVK